MSGWGPPPAPAPVVGWEMPVEPEGLGVRQSIGAGWRILRSHAGPLMGAAAIPEILRNLMVIPSLVIVARAWDAMITVFTETDWSNYDPEDQLAFQQRIQEAFQPPTDLAILSGVASGASITLALIGLAIVTAATLAAVDGRRPTVGGAYREVSAHASALIWPAVILGIGFMVVGIPLTLAQGTFVMSDAATMRTQSAIAAVLGLFGLVVSIAIIILAVRWSLAVPAILAEDLSLRRGLSRSAELTSGIRVRIFLIFLLLALLVGIVFGLISVVAALVVGVATFSFTGGVAGYLVAATIGGLVWTPLGAAVLSHVYRVRAGPPVTAGPMDGPGPGSVTDDGPTSPGPSVSPETAAPDATAPDATAPDGAPPPSA